MVCGVCVGVQDAEEAGGYLQNLRRGRRRRDHAQGDPADRLRGAELLAG